MTKNKSTRFVIGLIVIVWIAVAVLYVLQPNQAERVLAQLNKMGGTRITLLVAKHERDSAKRMLESRARLLGFSDYAVRAKTKNSLQILVPGLSDAQKIGELVFGRYSISAHGGVNDLPSALQVRSSDKKIIVSNPGQTGRVEVDQTPIWQGSQVVGAAADRTQNHGFGVTIKLNVRAAQAFSEYTKNNIGKPIAIVGTERRYRVKPGHASPIQIQREIKRALNIAVVRDQLSESFIISGVTRTEARRIAHDLSFNQLQANVKVIQVEIINAKSGVGTRIQRRPPERAK